MTFTEQHSAARHFTEWDSPKRNACSRMAFNRHLSAK
jgi:hypothetical protein